MEKTIIIGDIHIDSDVDTISEKIQILKDIFKQDCDRFILAGDIFHKRKQLNVVAVRQLQQLFSSIDKQIYIIVGNHDCRYKDSLYPNSISITLQKISNVTIIDKPTELDDFLLIPWICESNYETCVDSIKTSDKKYLVGHFEINGFEMVRGIECRTGFKKSDFNKFEQVFSGHFHLHQTDKNIIYIGSIYQQTWTDFNNKKGYYLIDNNIEFKSSDYQKEIYKHLILEDQESDFDIDEYSDCHLKIFHYKSLTQDQFEKIEELSLKSRTYTVLDESINLDETDAEFDSEFDKMIEEFLKHQDFEEDFKSEVQEYMIKKHEEI